MPPLNPWTSDPNEAIRIQETLRQLLVLSWDKRMVNFIGGVDFSASATSVCAVFAVIRFPELVIIESKIGKALLDFPYIPGLLAFRVGPAILAAWENLEQKPDVLLIHGHGIAHPRGLGLASHMGLWLNIPTIGVAKTLLYGCQTEPGKLVGDWSALLDENNSSQILGAVLRTRLDAKPVYVSAGHLVDLEHSIALVMACCKGYRMPELLRIAHRIVMSYCQHAPNNLSAIDNRHE